jgi:hypothetical protein
MPAGCSNDAPPRGQLMVALSTDMQAWHADSVVQDGQLTTVLVTLSRPPAQPKGISAWIWLTGGAVVAAGLGTGAYFLFRPGDKGPPPPVDGSLGTVPLPFRL